MQRVAPADRPPEPEFEIDGMRVVPQTGEVSGPRGREKLDPKVMDVLVFMARHAGKVVAREDLLAQLWPHAVVTDDALTRCFYELRRQLSRAGGSDRYKAMLETLPKRGYRLNAVVTLLDAPVTAATAGPPRRRSVWFAIAAAAAIAILGLAILRIGAWLIGTRQAATPVPVSIAVLPFVDMSEKQDQQYLSDGIAEEILNRLAQSEELDVKARTSSFSFRDRPLDVREIAKKLGVAHVLEGSVRRSGDRIRVTAQLIDGSTNAHVWSETYDRSLGDLFAVQDQIAGSVAAELKVQLTGGKAPVRKAVNELAYDNFLRGELFYNRRLAGDMELAVKYYEKAVALDPGYARAWASLAGAYNIMHHETWPASAVWTAKRGVAAHRAVELDPNLAIAHVRLAQHYWETDDDPRGRAHFEKARSLDPNDSMLLAIDAGRALWRGDLEEAVRLQRRAVARDPLSATHRHNLGNFTAGTGRFAEALAELRRAKELAGDGSANEDLEIVRLLVLLKRPNEAEPMIAGLPDVHRDYAMALCYHAQGRRAEADAALARLAAQPLTRYTIQLAEAYAFRGNRDMAFATLGRMKESALNDPNTPTENYGNIQESMRDSPYLIPLRTDPRWQSFFD